MEEIIDYNALDESLGSVDLDDVTSEKSGSEFEELPEGYYLCEVKKAELTKSKSSGNPMIKIQFKVIENGIGVDVNEKGDAVFVDIPKSKNRCMFKYYVLRDEKSVKTYVSDMLKFEGSEPGVPLLEKELFLSSVTMSEALNLLEGSQIHIQVSVSENKTTKEKSSWQNLISWSRAAKLELPM